jgi:hypothetical protein
MGGQAALRKPFWALRQRRRVKKAARRAVHEVRNDPTSLRKQIIVFFKRSDGSGAGFSKRFRSAACPPVSRSLFEFFVMNSPTNQSL